jgi:hypothetical protein
LENQYASAKKIFDDAVLLPVEERVLVVDSFLRSLNQLQSEIDRRWAEIAHARLQELRSGRLRPCPARMSLTASTPALSDVDGLIHASISKITNPAEDRIFGPMLGQPGISFL